MMQCLVPPLAWGLGLAGEQLLVDIVVCAQARGLQQLHCLSNSCLVLPAVLPNR